MLKLPTNKKLQAPGTVLLTVSGVLEAMFPASGRPGCVLELWNGRDTGLYYVPLAPHDCRKAFPEKARITFRVWQHAVPDGSGVIDTAGDASRLWDAATA